MRLATAGDNVVDCYRDTGLMYPGGNALNVAVFGKQAGASRSSYIGSVGTDLAGRHVLASVREAGVGVERVRVADGPNAYACVAVVDSERRFQGSSRGVVDFRLDDHDIALIRTCDVVHSGDCSGLEDQLDRLAGATRLSFDFGARYDETYAAPLLRHTWFATFSGGSLHDSDCRDLVKWAHDHGTEMVLVTRGALGAYFSDGSTIFEEPARTGGELVDTLGAGDAFIASMLVGIADGQPPQACLVRAAGAAADACSRTGAFGAGIPIEVSGPLIKSPPLPRRNHTPLRTDAHVRPAPQA